MKATKLAEEMGVVVAPGIEPMTNAARRALNRILRDLDDDERQAMVLMGAAGRWDWHLVDGTRRVWHISHSGRMSWNMLSDRALDDTVAKAETIIGKAIG